MRGIELAPQTFEDDIGVDVIARLASLVARQQAACNELGLRSTTFDAGPHRRFHELGQGFARRQHGLHFGAELGFDANGRDGA